MLKGKWVSRIVLMALASLALSFAGLSRPAPVMGDAIGCTGIRNTTPLANYSCGPSRNDTCYDCEYYYDGGADLECFESPDGTISYCKPYDDGSGGPPKV
jgi:hypothetical protein